MTHDVSEASREPVGAGGRSASWALSRRCMLRLAGLPIEMVQALRCPDTRRWADLVLDEEERLTAAGADLSELLHPLVNRHPDDRARRDLLRLRRDLFNNRMPATPDADLALLTLISASAADGVALWLDARRALDELRAEGAGLLERELAATRAELRVLAGEERLRLGLLLASPTLEAQLDRFVRSDPARPDKRGRKIERSLLAYLYRTACKTSPFSTFTGVALGEFAPPTSDDAFGLELPSTWSSHPRLNTVVLGRFADRIAADPVRRADLPLAPASGWVRDDDRVRYVRRWVAAGDDTAAVTFDAVRDQLFFLRRSGTLERMLARFEERPTMRYQELVHWLGTDAGAEPEECERYLAALLDLGMMQVPTLHTDVHSPDPLKSFRDAVSALDRPWGRQLAAALDAPIACIDRYPAADAATRRALLSDLRSGLGAALEAVGEGGAALPQTLLYEDVRVGDEPVPVAGSAWEKAVADPLRRLEAAMPAFDLTLAQRITFTGFFVTRYGRGGRCDDLLKLVHDFHEDFFDQYLTVVSRRKRFDDDGTHLAEENWLGLPGITALDRARERFVEGMRRAWDGREDGDDELLLDAGLLAEVAAELGPQKAEFTAQTHFLQPAAQDGEPLLVLNQSFGALSFPFSRFTHCFDPPAGAGARSPSLSDVLRRSARELQPEGTVFAELTGGPVSSNLNLHGQLADYEIVCPGETSSVPEENRIHLDDLCLRHDEESDRLVLHSTRLQRKVVPLYFGYLVPIALPEIPRTLLLLSPTSRARLDLWDGVPEGRPDRGVTFRPRVRHDSIVLSRRSWTVTVRDLPLPTPHTAEDEAFLDWNRWRRGHRIPRRVFASFTRGGAGGSKPQYVDFDSPLSLGAFHSLAKDPGATVVLREMLPDEDNLPARSGRGRHVAEIAVETFTTRTS
ncbi:Lantibiotic dehydratase, C terminus [Streptomyces sp. Ag82_O1-12]|nr:lantibiotic dehydratase [Streptomyces sp. Ag82_G6-1]SMQ14578.1 Lantibiotic dehydratase, C terminus [Streptomyces sp. Ag82_O1-12]SOD43606.1 Lantibiotic dehydratase, C terminus [Streptomyces sp. Ag82_G6-1]